MKYIAEAECVFCKEKVFGKSWELHEIWPDRWEVVCLECDEATGLSEGK